MIPVSLTIKGLYSYQKEQFIDFSKLMEGQLFGIFGSVGSGKSSILEAISYALYGDTERMNKNDNRSYNMMNLKSNELLIDFVFDNYDNKRYRFVVKGKRNSKQFNKVGTLDRTAYEIIDGIENPLESASGQDIIGLSYENFRRTIIIPQGKFQEFLQLGDKDRTEMLKDIFQLEKFEFFYQTASLEKKNQEEIQLLNGEMAVYATISEELILENKNKLTDLQANLKALQLQLEEKQSLFKEQEQLKKWHLELQNLEELAQNLEEKSAFYSALKKKIDDFEYCAIHFKELINKLDRGAEEIKKLGVNSSQLNNELELSKQRYLEFETNLNKWKIEFDKKDINRSNLDDYTILIKVINLTNELAEISNRIVKGQEHVDKILTTKTELTNKHLAIKAKLKLEKQSLPDLNILSDIRTWFTNYNAENLVFNKENTDLETKTAALKVLDAEISEVFKNKLFETDSITNLIEAKEAIDKYNLSLNNEEKELRELLTNYQVQLKLGEFSSTLKSGEACLLCGSLDHPSILVADDVQEHLDLCNQKLKEVLYKIQLLSDLSNKLEVYNHKKTDLEQQIISIKNQLKETKNRLKLVEKDFNWDGFSINDETLVLQQFNNAKNLSLNIKTLEESEEKLQLEINQTELTFNKYKEAVDKLQQQASEKQAEINTLIKQVKSSGNLDLLKESKELITEKLKKLSLYIAEVDTNYEHFYAKLASEQQTILLVNERLKANNNRLLEEKASLELTEQTLQQEMANSNYTTSDEITAILAQNLDLNKDKAKLQAYEQQVYAVKEDAKKVKALLADKVFNQEAFDVLSIAIKDFTNLIKESNNEFVKIETIYNQQQKDYQRKLILEQQLSKLNDRANNLNVLKNMFKGSGFVSYISSVYLNQLCASANERFYKLSRQQLRLELSDKNDFLVRDFLNDGRVRSVKTLSGGQTFQASLALALALAESVQQQNKAMQNFFFLDEGFGSLDKESLQVAFETLKSLRKENRLVGVISHVEELQQEIDVFLTITNSADNGSTVAASWE